MVEQKQVYIFFEREDYKLNKQILLQTQIDFIKLQKKIHHFKAIRSRKNRLLQELKNTFTRFNVNLGKLDTKLPDDKIPNEVKKLISKKPIKEKRGEKKIKEKEIKKEITDNLDRELLEIQKRLKLLEMS